MEALNEAIGNYGPPEIRNADQGSQFAGSDWMTMLTEAAIKGRG